MFLKFCGLPPPRRSRSIFQMKEPTPFHGSQAKKVVGQWAPCAAHFSPHPPSPPGQGWLSLGPFLRERIFAMTDKPRPQELRPWGEKTS